MSMIQPRPMFVIVFLAMALVSSVAKEENSAGQRPDIVFIIVDDLNDWLQPVVEVVHDDENDIRSLSR